MTFEFLVFRIFKFLHKFVPKPGRRFQKRCLGEYIHSWLPVYTNRCLSWSKPYASHRLLWVPIRASVSNQCQQRLRSFKEHTISESSVPHLYQRFRSEDDTITLLMPYRLRWQRHAQYPEEEAECYHAESLVVHPYRARSFNDTACIISRRIPHICLHGLWYREVQRCRNDSRYTDTDRSSVGESGSRKAFLKDITVARIEITRSSKLRSSAFRLAVVAVVGQGNREADGSLGICFRQ